MQLNNVFIDIGCGAGQRAAQWCNRYRDSMVYCFEPQHELYQRAEHESHKRGCEGRMHVFPVVITSTIDQEGEHVAFHIANDTSSSSMLPFDKQGVKLWKYPPGRLYFKNTETRHLPAMRMGKFLVDRRIERVAFCRIETQGNAIDTLRSFGTQIKKVSEFAVKVHAVDFQVYENQTHRDELIAFMREKGFVVYATRSYSCDQEEIIWFANKNTLKMAGLPHLDLEK